MAAPTGVVDQQEFPDKRAGFTRMDGLLDEIDPAAMDLPHSRALRHGRWSEAGRIYLITFTTAGRRRYFVEWAAAQVVASFLASQQAWADSRLLCWVLMPDHWHGLLELGAGETLSRNVGRAKAGAARQWNQALAKQERLWAPGFHDHAVRRKEDLQEIARYVIANPLRARLVERIGDYPFWDAIWR